MLVALYPPERSLGFQVWAVGAFALWCLVVQYLIAFYIAEALREADRHAVSGREGAAKWYS